jgi:hypothetical protein
MKKALISPNESSIKYISDWNADKPVYSTYPNSCRVAEVCDAEFEVAAPLFWVDCSDDVIANKVYFNIATNQILPIVNVPIPVVPQPTE